ncbi:MAG TPA: ABC transporter permease [Byssovorax sp.]|jgi:lipoprotein-releasing system permease protein
MVLVALVLIIVFAVRSTPAKEARKLLWAMTGVTAVSFSVLTTLAIRHPKIPNGPYHLADTLLPAFALDSGVIFLVALLGSLLPLALDLLERRGFAPFVAARHVRATKSGFLTVISVLSMGGVAVSSCALCAVTSIMGGFGHDLKAKILQNNGHIVVDSTRTGGFGDWHRRLDAVQEALDKQGGGAATPVVGGDAMGSSASNTAGVLVRGIDPDSIGKVVDLKKNIEVGAFDYLLDPEKLVSLPPDSIIGRGPGGEPYYKGPEFKWESGDPALKDFLKPSTRVYPGVILGRELAKSLHVLVGDEITLLSPIGELGPTGVMPMSKRFRVAGIFYSGMYEFDASHAYVLLKDAQKFFGMLENDHITQIDIRVPEPEKVKDYRASVDAAAASVPFDGPKGAALRSRDWMEMNKGLFSALKLEKIATFIILSIAIAVASFCIVCTLLLMVTEKGKEIAILKALGASNEAIRRTFMIEGMIIGGIGTVFGVGIALALCTGLATFGVGLDPDVYYINRLPVNVDPSDYALVAVCAFIICTLAAVYPADAASKLEPVEGLRWE